MVCKYDFKSLYNDTTVKSIAIVDEAIYNIRKDYSQRKPEIQSIMCLMMTTKVNE